MRSILIISIVCLSVIFTQAQNKDETEKKQKIEGVVTDFFGVPWEGATLKLKSKGVIYSSSNAGKDTKIEREAKTDSNGKYSFTDLPEDSYEVTLLRMGTTLEETKQTGVIFNGKTYRLDFGVEVGAISECRHSVIGVVKDEAGSLLKGAKISVFSAFNQRRFLSSITDEQGFYQISICSLGDYIVFANTPKYEVQTTNVSFQTWNDNFKTINFKLKPLSQQRLNWRK